MGHGWAGVPGHGAGPGVPGPGWGVARAGAWRGLGRGAGWGVARAGAWRGLGRGAGWNRFLPIFAGGDTKRQLSLLTGRRSTARVVSTLRRGPRATAPGITAGALGHGVALHRPG